MAITKHIGVWLAVLALPWLVGTGCSSSQPPDSACGARCAAGFVCNAAQQRCLPAGAECEALCGPNASCMDGGLCTCAPGFIDCNMNLGQSGGDGCECNSSCSGIVCGGLSLDGGSDGPVQQRDGSTTPDTGPSCSSTNAAQGCGDVQKYCDFGQCKACPAGKYNCNGTADCECETGCNGTQCQGATSCDYTDLNACGNEPSKWCYQNECISCSSGWFNCNHTKGCECDSAGCNGDQCAGNCSGGEC